jgi:hypothetical protein
VPSLRPLASLGTTPTTKSPQFNPSGLLKHLRSGLVHTPHHFLTTRMEPWGFIKSSAETYIIHMKLSLCLSFPAQTQPRGLQGGHHKGIPSPDHGSLSPIVTPLTLAATPTTSYEYLFCLPSSDQLRPPIQRKAQGLLSGSCTPDTAGHRLRSKNPDTTDSHQQQMVGGPRTPY